MNFILALAMKNKLATALCVIILALTVFCGFQYLAIKTLSAQLEVAENNLRARTAALQALEAEAEILEDRIKASKQRIAHNKKVYEQKLSDIADTRVPQDCPDAVQWGATEFNKMMEDF